MGTKYIVFQLPSWKTSYFPKGIICQPRHILRIFLNFRKLNLNEWFETDVVTSKWQAISSTAERAKSSKLAQMYLWPGN